METEKVDKDENATSKCHWIVEKYSQDLVWNIRAWVAISKQRPMKKNVINFPIEAFIPRAEMSGWTMGEGLACNDAQFSVVDRYHNRPMYMALYKPILWWAVVK